MSSDRVNRREFIGMTAASIAGGTLGLGTSASAGVGRDGWDASRPLVRTGKALTVQPVLMYSVAQKRPQTSWKSWGGVQTDAAATAEAQKITEELSALASRASVPLEILPIVKIKTAADAADVHRKEYDAIVVYAASGSGDLLRACFAPQKDRDTILFVRHRSGTAYYWYEALSTRYLQTGRPEPGRNSYLDHGGVHVEDVVVDDYDELLWRLRALYGLKNFLGTRIIALGGPWGKYSPEAPQVAREKYRFNIIDISYETVAPRIKAARENPDAVAAAQRWAEAYLSLPHTTLATDKGFVTNAFLLLRVFQGPDAGARGIRLHDPQLHEHDHADRADDALPDAGSAQRRGLDGLLRVRFRHHPRRHPPAPHLGQAGLPAQLDVSARRDRDLRPLQQPAPAGRPPLRADDRS